MHKDRFPKWFSEEIDFLAETSKKLMMKREISFYGGKGALLTPEELISEKDAYDALKIAEKTYMLCSKFLKEYIDKIIGEKPGEHTNQ